MNPREGLLVTLVGEEWLQKHNLTNTALIVCYEDWTLRDFDSSKPSIIDSDKDRFWKRLNNLYPGPGDMPSFMGRIRHNIFMPIIFDEFLHIGQ